MLTEEERKEAIQSLTEKITDDLCHLKDMCLADSGKIDSAIKHIVENISSEMQQGFTRYYTIKFSSQDAIFDLCMRLAPTFRKEGKSVYAFTQSITTYIPFPVLCGKCQEIFIINHAYMDAIFGSHHNPKYPELFSQGYWCPTCKVNTSYQNYMGKVEPTFKTLALSKEDYVAIATIKIR